MIGLSHSWVQDMVGPYRENRPSSPQNHLASPVDPFGHCASEVALGGTAGQYSIPCVLLGALHSISWEVCVFGGLVVVIVVGRTVVVVVRSTGSTWGTVTGSGAFVLSSVVGLGVVVGSLNHKVLFQHKTDSFNSILTDNHLA